MTDENLPVTDISNENIEIADSSASNIRFNIKMTTGIHFYECPPNASHGEMYDALTQIRHYLLNIMAGNKPAESPPEATNGG